MSAVIGALRAELSASIAQFQSDMGKAADSLRGFSKEAKSISRDLEEVGRKMSLAITAPLALLARGGYEQAKAAREAIGQVQAALESSGDSSGKTAAELEKTADALQHISTFEKTDILRNVTAQLLTFSNIQGPIFDRAQKAVIDLAARMGGDLQDASVKVGRALNDPIQGVQALTRVGVQFTTQEKLQIKNLVEHGKGLEAQGIILDKLTQKYGGAALALREASPDAKAMQEWHDFEQVLGNILIQFLPPLVELLTSVLHAFEAIPEPLQKVIVGVAAVAAVIGPILLIFSPMVRIIGIMVPLIKGLAIAFWGLSTPILATIAAIAGVALAIFLFRKAIADVLNGEWSKAWEDAKNTAAEITDSILGTFDKLTKPGKVEVPVVQTGGGKGKGGLNFDLHNEADLAKTAAAAKALAAQLSNMAIQVQHGLDGMQLDQATADAAALNAKIDDYVARAKDAGVNTKAFANQVAFLRARIGELKDQGIEREAAAFSEAVNADKLAVDRFAKGGLPPLQEKLAAVDDQYSSIKDKIVEQIKENEGLAEVSEKAALALADLRQQLLDLEDAHKRATKAAEDQVQAEQGIAHLESYARQLDVKNQIVDAKQAANGTAPVSSNQADLQAAQRQLDQMTVEAETNYQKAVNERREGEKTLSDEQKKDLDEEIRLNKELADVVASTTAEQLVGARRVNEAFQEFTDSLTNTLSDMIANWSFDLKGLYGIFRQLAEQLFIKPVVGAATDALGGLLKGAVSSLFSGAHAKGGYIPPGHWGVVGEKGPEPAYGGRNGLTVVPNSGGGGVTQVFNISTPDANSFRRSARQIQRSAKQRLSL